jgi:hypothetical protein
MIKTFQQFYRPINEDLLDAEVEIWSENAYISKKSAFWRDSLDYFKKETGSDLTKFNWVFKDKNPSGDINAANFIVALMQNSTVMGKKYQATIDGILELLTDGDLNYHSKAGGDSTYVNMSVNAYNNSEALFTIWVNYFYEPLKKAIVSKDFSAISMDGMKDFEERMELYTADFDSDWKKFFADLRKDLQYVAQYQNVPLSDAPSTPASSAPAAPIAAPVTKPSVSSGSRAKQQTWDRSKKVSFK